MSRNTENQLTEHIKQVLYNHEEPYVLGSWERFKRYKTRTDKARVQKLYLAIAASFLLALTFAFAWINFESATEKQYADEQHIEQDETENKSVQLPSDSENPSLADAKTEYDATESEGTEQREKNNVTPQKFRQNTFLEVPSPVSRQHVPQYTFVRTDPLAALSISENSDNDSDEFTFNTLRAIDSDSEDPHRSHVIRKDDLQDLSGRNQQKVVVFSIAYASLMNVHNSQTDFGAGGGFYADWNFARNVSVSSGLFIAQNQLKYKNTPGSRVMVNITENDNPEITPDNLTHIQLDLVNLEIPLHFRYHLTDELSVSAGISSMAFLKEEYEYNFEYEQQIQVFENSETGEPQLVSKVVTVRTTETQSEPSLNRMNWAAFYTFSFGYQQTIFQRHSASFEPFIKIPAGRVTSRGISYTTGGIQLKVSF